MIETILFFVGLSAAFVLIAQLTARTETPREKEMQLEAIRREQRMFWGFTV